MRFGQFAAIVLGLTLSFCAAARANTHLDVEAGWGGHLRTGRWCPVFVTASDNKLRNVALDIQWPDGGSYTMRIQQAMTIDANPRTFPLLVPVRGWAYQEATFALVDRDSGKTLARFPDDPSRGSTFSNPYSDSGVLIGITGAVAQLDSLQQTTNSTTGFIDPRRVPDSPLGFDSLTLLVLNEPNLVPSNFGPAELNDAQQRAIVDWVRAGGNLIIWPGDAGLPSTGPLVGVLPARVKDRVNLNLSPKDLLAIGLASRFKNLAVYHLEGKGDSKRIPLLNAGQADAYASRLGLGHIVLAPMNIGEMQIGEAAQARNLWRPVLKGILPITEANAVPNGYYNVDETREDAAAMRIADFLGNVPGAGQIGFSYIAMVLIGMMIIVGPLDWIVLKKLGRQPWTWVTTTGWVTLVTVGALYAGYLFKSGDLDYKTIRTIDQVGDATIASTDYVSLYSSRTQSYEIQAANDGWWQPAGTNDTGGSGLKLDMDFHQTSEGNTPEEMVVNVWSLRFLRGDTIGAGPAMIAADLKTVLRSENAGGLPRVVGSVTNLSEKTLKNIHISTQYGSGMFIASDKSTPASGTVPATAPAAVAIAPHATAMGFAAHSPTPPPAPVAPTYARYRYRYDNTAPPDESELGTLTSDLNVRRGKEMEALVATGKFAIIYAEVDQPTPAAMLVGHKAIERHREFVRALVELH